MTKTLIRPLPALVAAMLAPAAAQAVEFAAGGWNGSFDTTVSFGQTWREQSRDPRLIATANGGTGRSPNIDDGNLNYRKGRVSSAYKMVAELSLDRGENFGVFVRGSLLYDTIVEDSRTERTPISEEGKDLAGSYLRLLDAFVYGRWDLAGHELDVRAGRQVVNWGESTFIQGGINAAINHFDVSALRAPGSELREAYLPQELLKVGFGVTDNVTVEAIGIWDWNATRPEPVGTYFASNDFVPRGGEQVFLGFGAFSDQGTDFRPLGGPFIENFQGVPRGETITPSDSGQYGAALRWFMPDFAQGTELGFFFVNYHSKLPVISGRTGTQAGIGNALGALTASIATAQGLASGLPFDTAVGIAANAGRNAAIANGGDLSLETAADYATIAGNTVLGGGSVSAQASALATHEYAQTARYFTEFPEDIQLLGLSFNTQLGTTGVALQGEVSYRMDVPLQFDDVELLFAALTPFEAAALAAQGVPMPATCAPPVTTLARCGPARRLRPRPGRAGLGRVRRVAEPDDGDPGLPADARRRAARGRGRSGLYACFQHAEQDRGRAERAGHSLQRPGHIGLGQSRARGAALRRGGAARPLRRRELLGLPRGAAARLPQPDRRLEFLAALRLVPGRRRHDAGAGRQLRRRPHGRDFRRARELPVQPGVRRELHRIRRRGALQRADRPRLLRRDDQVFVLIRPGDTT